MCLKFQQRRQRMLHEVGANFAVIETLPQTAESEGVVGEKPSIAVLDNQTIEEEKAVCEGAAIAFVAPTIGGLSCD